MNRFSSFCILIVACLSLVSVNADDQLGFGPVRPCTVHGKCTTCNTDNCSSCSKCSSGNLGLLNQLDQGACKSCEDKSLFCKSEANRLFEDKPKSRKNCFRDGANCSLGCLGPISVYIPRSQGANTARELAGWEEFIYQYDVGGYYLTTAHTLGYSHSLRSERIARLLFGDCVLSFSGSQVADRGRCEILADNFGLSPYVRGTLRIHPEISNIIFDNQFFFGLDPVACGLYARIHMPLVHTRWNLCLNQTSNEEECQPFPPCAVGGEKTGATCNIIEALSGTYTFGDMLEPWRYGRIVPGMKTKTALADIDLILGYNLWQTDYYHFGFYGQLVCPTGNKPTGRFVFEPLVGNSKHWELGLGMTGHFVLWERDAFNSFALYVEGNVTHLFKNSQMRSFDFCGNGPLSRYMLLKELDKQGDNYNYTGTLINGINIATRPVEVSVAAKGDISAKLCFRTPCLIFDLGYNFYGITSEHLEFKKGCSDEKLYGIKGTEGVCGLEYAVDGNQLPATFGPLVGQVPLNSTQHRATIRHGAKTDNAEEPQQRDSSDIVVTAYSVQTGPVDNPGVQRAFVSAPPVIVSPRHLHKASGTMPAQASHKVFGYLGWNFNEADWCYNPYLGIGGELELEARSKAERTALNQWSVWVKGGFEF